MILIAGFMRFITQTDQLAYIRKRGCLRVGTPGDYHLLSYFDGETFSGYDIDMAAYLAEQLGVEVEFVLTARQALVSGLYSDQFDIAMGGIPRSVSGQYEVEQTQSYLTFHHVLMTTADNQSRFSGFEQLNRPEVKIGVHVGQIYQTLAEQYFPAATIVPFENYLNMPLAVEAGQIDVMMTETPFAQFYQVAESPLVVVRELTQLGQHQFSYLLPLGQQRLLNMVNLMLDDIKLKGIERQLMVKHALHQPVECHVPDSHSA
ncbi:transporter substrate-binding domain-containing protein [Vibrio gazogenes]|uniref:Cyclohexadienyl dehydratase n=1 Tax=Vibrio gazogenes DSM 21264 = NBRC 103151 TaxID=1123492 RepID=A0A1M4SNQ9_VIBGA|nr:transporter substrate-binding domain-containing protein [Vibrio gazogenes]USP15906.1 transporter substrate-binding domain-containing protein [Vibrio gazogenes]SHE33567.1 cyclohexadienyl dehydratase [Vibrio gazogenes DSM 21264] [Vibrio gazogenes DSM 21264 = NBRC 103151]